MRLGPFRALWDALQPRFARKRLYRALAISLALHALLLLLTFGSGGLGLPGLVAPVAERPLPPAKLYARLAELAPEPASAPVGPGITLRASPLPPQPAAVPRRVSRARAPAAKERAPTPKVQPKPKPPVLAQRKPQPDTFKVPPPPPPVAEPQRAPQVAAAKQPEEPPAAPDTTEIDRRKAEEAARVAAEEAARRQAAELEARKLAEAKAREEAAERERQSVAQQQAIDETRKEEEARRVAEAQKLAREEEARRLAEAKQAELKKQAAAKRAAELARQEELKKEEARRLALEVEALRRAEELARQAAQAKKELEAKRLAEEAAKRAQQEAAAARAEAEAKAAAAQRERERLAAQKPGAPGAAGPSAGPASAAGPPSGRELAAKALEQLRTPGGRDDLTRAPGPPPPVENLRRRALIGVERDVSLRMYVDSWRWKIERNGALNYRRSASGRVYEPPIVTVSIRSDGSLEHVSIHRSSGVGEIDEAVRRIVHLHAPYSAFPPAIARQYDVLDIRRVWFFEDQLRIRDE